MNIGDKHLPIALEMYHDSAHKGYSAAWLYPDGYLVYAKEGHEEYAQKVYGFVSSSRHEDLENVNKLMFSQGCVSVTLEREEIEILYDKEKVNPSVLWILVDIAKEFNIPLLDEVTGKVLYSPYVEII